MIPAYGADLAIRWERGGSGGESGGESGDGSGGSCGADLAIRWERGGAEGGGGGERGGERGVGRLHLNCISPYFSPRRHPVWTALGACTVQCRCEHKVFEKKLAHMTCGNFF